MRSSRDAQFSYPVVPHGHIDVGPEIPQASAIHDMREFYDPANRQSSRGDGDFIDGVASTRHPVAPPGLKQLNGHEVILAEATHLLLNIQNEIELPIASEKQHKITEQLQKHAGMVATSIIEVADEIIAERGGRLQKNHSLDLPTLPNRIVLTGKVMGATAHSGVFRRSGRNYFSHPDEVSSIISTAWHRNMGDSNNHLLDIIRFLAYTHDGPEDSIDARGKYLEKRVVISPLVAKILLEQQDVPEAFEMARTLYMLMRTKDVEGYRMDYMDYVDRGIQQPGMVGSLFILTKSPDVRHNLSIEPEKVILGDVKANAKLKKRQSYEDAAVRLLRGAEKFDGPLGMVPHAAFTISPEEIAHASTQKYSFDSEKVARAVTARVLRKQAA